MKADELQTGRRNHCHQVAFRPYRRTSAVEHRTLSQLAMVGFWPLGLSSAERDDRDELRVCLVRGQHHDRTTLHHFGRFEPTEFAENNLSRFGLVWDRHLLISMRHHVRIREHQIWRLCIVSQPALQRRREPLLRYAVPRPTPYGTIYPRSDALSDPAPPPPEPPC